MYLGEQEQERGLLPGVGRVWGLGGPPLGDAAWRGPARTLLPPAPRHLGNGSRVLGLSVSWPHFAPWICSCVESLRVSLYFVSVQVQAPRQGFQVLACLAFNGFAHKVTSFSGEETG